MHLTLTTRDRRRPRRLLCGLAVAVAAAGVAGFPPGTAQAAPAPHAVAGDRFSPTVVALATAALTARDEYAIDPRPETFHIYEERLAATAAGVAAEFAADPASVLAAWQRSDLAGQTAMLAALTQLGKDYEYAASDPAVGFDCSGLTAYAWRRAGVELPRQSSAQIDVAPSVADAEALGGDLVQYPGHVMLYLGFDDAMVHAANEATDVELAELPDRSLNWAAPEA